MKNYNNQRNYDGMNNDLCSIISKIFAYETNVTKMEKGRLTDWIDMRYHTEGLIKSNSKPACILLMDNCRG